MTETQFNQTALNSAYHSYDDHFNFPIAQKKDTMYLSTIKNEESGFKQLKIQRDNVNSLNTQDIDRAKPYYPGFQYTNKEIYANRNDDIEGSAPKKFHQPLNKLYYTMKTDDIKGTKPQAHKFHTTRKPTDPLNPEYKLPYCEVRIPTPPKFVRDNININDIDGTRPNLSKKWNIDRKNLDVDDIAGAHPKKEWIPNGKFDNLNVKDINEFLEFHTRRQTNPLSPRYVIPDENNNKLEYGEVNNKVMPMHPIEVHREISFDLRTTDIEGAQAGTSNEYYKRLQQRQHIRSTDIPGAQAGTRKRGISTERQTNPLVPNYQIPGNNENPPNFDRTATIVKKFGGNTTSLADLAQKNLNMASSMGKFVSTNSEGASANGMTNNANNSNIANNGNEKFGNTKPTYEASKAQIQRPAEYTKNKTNFANVGEKSLQNQNVISYEAESSTKGLSAAQKLDRFIQ